MTVSTYEKQLATTYRVKTHDVDIRQEMKLPEIMNLLQELATQHADKLNFGYDHLVRKNQFWVLSRMRLEFHQMPAWKQSLDCLTWSNGLDGIFPLRNWQLSTQNAPVLSGYAQWLILDARTHRPARPDATDFEGKILNKRATSQDIKKLRPFSNAGLLGKFTVRLHELDMNGHVNNVFYMAWILDSLGPEHAETYRIQTLDINYLKEVTYPNTVSVLCNEEQNRFMLVSGTTPTVHCLVDVTWACTKESPEHAAEAIG